MMINLTKFLKLFKWFEEMTWYKKIILFASGMFYAFVIHVILISLGVL